MSKAAPAMGSFILLHRRLDLPCFPEAEAGPAAIVSNRRLAAYEVAHIAASMQDGSSSRSDLGAQQGEPKSVAICSPWVLGIDEFSEAADIRWYPWEAGTFPGEIEADVFFVWLPLRVLRRMTIARAAEYLVEAVFGSGAVYSDRSVRGLLAACDESGVGHE